MKLRRHRGKKLLGIGGVTLAVCLVLSVLAIVMIGRSSHSPTQKSTPITTTKPTPKPTSVSVHTLYFGNAYWGRYMNDWSMASPLKTAYPFSRLGEFHRDQYDAWIAGLECPTVAGFSQTSAEEDATLSFNCSPTYLPEAAKWFTAFTLANNHTDNQGPEGFIETKQHLQENNIQYFGHYDPYITDDACQVLAIPATVRYDDGSTKKQALPLAFCAYHGVFKIPPADSLAQINKYAAYFPVVVMPHMGKEYVATPDELKTSLYHTMIDQGADMVLGDHPHWVQTSEAYKGKPIFYSMGNFMFDQQDTAEVTRSAAIDITLKADNSEGSLEKWLALGDTCKNFHDDCFAKAQQQNLKKITPQYTIGIVGTNDAGKITKPATEAQTSAILDRLQWSNTKKQLQAPFTGL